MTAEVAWTPERVAEELAFLLAKARARGNVYMGGEHNPTPDEIRTAREFVAAVFDRGTNGERGVLGGSGDTR